MHELYRTLILPVIDRDREYMTPSDLAVKPINVYTRIQFQKTIYSNPFLVSLPSFSAAPQTTFKDWLLGSSLENVVDMDGLFYFSLVEEYVAKAIKYPYPIPQSWFEWQLFDVSVWDHDPTGEQFDEFKIWFESYATTYGLISEKMHQLVTSSYRFHQANHWSYHRHVLSSLDLGVNVIGWHGGIFGLGVQTSKLYLAIKASGLGTNAIALNPLLISDSGPKYLHPSLLGYNLTRLFRLCFSSPLMSLVNPYAE